MKHARADYAHIQDPTGKIPADEPVFLLRASDVHAPGAVDWWARLHHRDGGEMASAAMEQADRMREWQRTHGGGKLADLPKVAIEAVPYTEQRFLDVAADNARQAAASA